MKIKIKKRVLVVDDMKNWRDLLKDILSPDYAVTVLNSFEEAKEIIAALIVPFHVAILDIRLVDRDANNREGLEIARLLNAMGEYTKTIILTGYSTIDIVKEAFRDCSVYDYVEKVPKDGEEEFDVEAFRQTVHMAATKASQQNVIRGINVLLIEEEKYIRDKIKETLSRVNYIVEGVSRSEVIMERLVTQKYDLLILNVDLLGREPGITDLIQKKKRNAKIIALKHGNIDYITKAMLNGSDHEVIDFDGAKKVSYQVFRDKVNQFMAPPFKKYLYTCFEERELTVGSPNWIVLRLASQPGEKANTPIWFSPLLIKRGVLTLELSIRGAEMGIRAYVITWDISLVKEMSEKIIEVTPKVTGEHSITIDINHNGCLLCSFSIKRKVSCE